MSGHVGSPALALLVLALPFASFLLLALARPVRRSAPAAATVSIAAVAVSLLTAALTLLTAVARGLCLERVFYPPRWQKLDGYSVEW